MNMLKMFAILALICNQYTSQPQHPFGPHLPPKWWPFFNHRSFFQGWYTRVTGAEHSSLAVIIGQYVPQPGQSQGNAAGSSPAADAPPILCMVMHQPSYVEGDKPPPPRSVTQYFKDISITNSTDASYNRGAGNGASKEQCNCPVADIDQPIPPPTFSARTVHPADKEGAICELKVSPAGFVVLADIPGAVSVEIHSQGQARRTEGGASTADFCFLPWSKSSAIAEGWAQYLGPLIGVHYSLLTMRTPVTIKGSWAPETSKEVPSINAVDLVSAHDLSLDGRGLLHTEAQWGSGFPLKWIWAEGQQYFNDATDAHGACSLTGFCGGDAGGVTFMMAGGDLAHALSPPLPQVHLFLFSYRDSRSGTSITSDPSNPALVSAEEVDACAGSARITLKSFSHVITVELHAPPESFFPAACPTEKGFKPYSVESFAAKAHVRITNRYAVHEQETKATKARRENLGGGGSGRGGESSIHRTESSDIGAGFGAEMGGSEDSRSLVAEIVLQGAAMEFGGQYRCEQFKE